MNTGRGRQNCQSGNTGAGNPSGRQGGGGLLSSIGKLVGGNANLLPLITNLMGNNGGGSSGSMGSLSALAGLMNNNNNNSNPLAGLAGMMGNMNNNAAANPLSALAGMMNNKGGNFSGYKNSPPPPANLDINEVLSRLSAMMPNNGGSAAAYQDHEEHGNETVIDTEENPRGQFSAANNGQESAFPGGAPSGGPGGLNMENLAAFWPVISSLLNNGKNNEPLAANGNFYNPQDSKRQGKEALPSAPYLKTADKDSEPYAACINCMQPCYRRQLPLPSFEQVRGMAQNWSRY